MTSLIRDVLFPSAAALGLLAAAITDSAMADESYYDEPTAVIAAAPITVATTSRPLTAQVSATTTAQPKAILRARAKGNRSNGVEARCERTDRIGKFKITRCD